MNTAQIQLTATQGLTLVQTTLTALKAFIPAIAAAGGPIGLGISAVAALIPLISKIPTGGTIDDATQAECYNTAQDIISGKAFEGEDWQQSGYEAAATHVAAAQEVLAAHPLPTPPQS